MRFPIGAFVFLNSGSPLLQVLSEPDDEGRIIIEWFNYDHGKDDRAIVNELCFTLADVQPDTEID